MDIPQSFASNVFPPQQTTFTPVFSGGPPRTAAGPTQIPAETLLALGPSAREIMSAPFTNGVFFSPSPVELLLTIPTGFQCQMP